MTDQPLQAILADDDKDDCLLFTEAIHELSLSIKLTVLDDGEQLVQWLARKKNRLPDIIFLDLNMPKKNGLEFLSEIRNNDKYKSISIIIVSTSIQEDILDLLYKNGAQYYINKPADFSELKKLISAAITLRMQKNSAQPPRKEFVLKTNAALLTK